MSQLTNYAENKIADFFRGQGLTLPTNWYMALASAASDATFTELSGTSYARQPVLRALASWAGTQGAGTTLASSGSSHATSNNAAVSCNPGAAWGTATHVGMFDQITGGNCWAWIPLASSIVITTGTPNPVQVIAGAIALSLGLGTGGCSDYLSNKLIDLLFRNQAFSWPASVYASLYTVAPTSAGGGTEVAGGAYARQPISSSLAAWSGTQGAGTTAASSGTAGRISNNSMVSFPAPTADWGTLVAEGLRDAASAGNLLFFSALTPKSVLASSPAPTHAADSLGITVA